MLQLPQRQQSFDALDEPQKRGDAAEAIIKAAFLLRDVPVLVPENDNEPYDIVVDIDGSFYRVQCKTGYRDAPGGITFETRSTRVKSSGYERGTYRGKADLFAIYNPVKDVVYLSTSRKRPQLE
ncbi:MAG: group I intron-associated PD-(D/E)XK endonuclease [Halobacteriales archaeon]